MKSPLLASKLCEIFGKDGEITVRRMLAAAAGDYPALVKGVSDFIDAADQLVQRFSSLHQVQADLSGDAFSDWNLKTGRIDSGKQWKTLLDYADADLEDSIHAWRLLVQPDDLQAFNAAVVAHARGESRFFQAECRLKSKTGSWKSLFLKGMVAARDAAGEPVRLLLLHRDITEFRASAVEAESARVSAEAASRARSFFIANMSHEIRTPMNGIIGMTDLALDTQLDAEQRHYLKTVKSSAESLLSIVNDVLDFSKIEAGKLRFEKIPFSLSSLVFEAVRNQAVEAHKKGLEVIVSLSPDVPARIVGDPTRVRQVISNLMGNAVKFTEQGTLSVTVSVEERGADFVLLRFAVRDTGIGIPVSRQGAVFEAFSQADDSTTRRYGGTGLGLSICTHLVQLMGGKIWLDSAEGQGSCFYFTARFSVDSAVEDEVKESRFDGQRLLLLEGHPALAEQLAMLLTDCGVQVTVIADPQEALAVLKKTQTLGFPYSIVMADAHMPPPAGIVLAESWKSLGYPGKLIMLLDTEQQRQHLKRLRELGVDAHLVKPVAREDLIEALQSLDGQREAEDLLLDSFVFPEQFSGNESEQVEVLLVEDNPVNQELAQRLLIKRGYSMTLANNGAEAVECFEKAHFDLILMDVQMPVMDGIEAAESIRSREMRRSWVVSQEFRPVYIIAMTANAMDGDRERCLQAGMNDYVAKPIKPSELYAAIDRGLSDGQGSEDDASALRTLTETSLDLRAAMRDLGDQDLLQTMAGMLVSEWDQHLSRIQSDLTEKNAEKLCMDAHTIKSLLAIFHGEKARRMALELEHAAKQAEGVDWGHCVQLAATLAEEMAQLKPEMEHFVRDGSLR
ncbi:MAG: response regulator [Betaproteobacteria bacterium]